MKHFIESSLFFGPVISLAVYEGGLLLKRKYKLAILNPLLITAIVLIAFLAVTHVEYETYNESAKYISYFLTPATVALAVPLYEQLKLLKENLAAVLCGLLAGVLTSLVSIFLLAKLFGLNHEQYVTLLPKSITTAIGMGVSEEMGGIAAITVAVICVTGMIGDMTSEWLYRILKIKHPIAKGLALGTASHAMGTAKAMEMGEIEGAMGSLAIVTAGLLTVVGASFFAQLM
nr:LrgB family protein [uncultured Sellimonas sp.]